MSAVTSSSFPYFLYTTTSQQPMSQTLNEAPLTSLLVGFTVGSVLFGVVLLESYRYFQTYKSDPRQLKLLVILVWQVIYMWLGRSRFCTIHPYTIPLLSANGTRLGKSSADLECEDIGNCSNHTIVDSRKVGVAATLLSCVQTAESNYPFLQVCILSEYATGLVAFSAIISLAVGFAFTVEIILVGSILDFTKLKWEFCVFFGANAAIALVITVVSIYLLHRSVTGIKRLVVRYVWFDRL
ncbi:hypothetical protein D9757_009126 [Collybiopsis confluens]|uniref:Uncharacterized protein n=1 Tax=Collybiopsis confluens TaxID=2823264 RepID=A0A8H5H916_9AGAR|nr:hypothetical protein D9757_009126 [Collybiopsis confluens]